MAKVESTQRPTALRHKTGHRQLAALFIGVALFSIPIHPTWAQPSNPADGKEAPPGATTSKLTLKTLIIAAREYSDSGNYGAAAEAWEEIARRMQSELGDQDRLLGISLNQLSWIYKRLGLLEKAENAGLRSLSILSASGGSDGPEAGAAMINLAQINEAQGKFFKAEAFATNALSIYRSTLGPSDARTAIAMNTLATIYQQEGYLKKSQELFSMSLEILEKEKGAQHQDVATGLNNLAGVYEEVEEFSKAAQLLSRALTIYEKVLGPSHPHVAASLINLASVYQRQGLTKESEPLLSRALTIYAKTADLNKVEIANALNLLGWAWESKGEPAEAKMLMAMALSAKEKALGIEHPSIAGQLDQLGVISTIQGQYSEAERLFTRALEIQVKHFGQDSVQTSNTLGNLASVYTFQGQHRKAETLLVKALSLSQRIRNEGSQETAAIASSLAINQISQAKYEQALAYLKLALESEIRWLRKELPILPESIRLKQLDRIGLSWVIAPSLTQHLPAASSLAFESILNRKGLLQEIEKRQTALPARATDADLQDMEQLKALTQHLASVTLPRAQRVALHEQRDRLQSELYRKLPDLQIQTISTTDVEKALPQDGVLVEFQHYQPYDGRKPRDQRWSSAHYVALVLKPNGAISAVQLGPAAAIDATIHKGLSASAEDQKDAETFWRELSQKVLLPLLPHLSGSHQWFISPDGELNRVPFAALPAPQQPQTPLAEAVQLRLLGTGRELVRLQQASPNSKPALVMANPRFDRSSTTASTATADATATTAQRRSSDLGSTTWRALPGTEQEGRQVASLLATTLVEGTAASTTTLRRQQGPRILHIASHGFFIADQEAKPTDPLRNLQDQAPQLQALRQEDPQLRSGLVLAGANQPDADPNDDGYLTAAEALMLDLKGTELVVLSACSTGQGEIRSGEGVYGLQRSLTVAGARSTLLSLWKVDDAATAEFMTRFYKRLKAGEGRADALAATQREFREGLTGHPDWKEPSYWAAWQLVGDWRPIPDL